jgi:hypothetical protein
LGRPVLVDRPPEEQVNEQRWIAVMCPGTAGRPLLRKDLSRGLTDAPDVATEVVEDRRLPRARGTGEDGEVGRSR